VKFALRSGVLLRGCVTAARVSDESRELVKHGFDVETSRPVGAPDDGCQS